MPKPNFCACSRSASSPSLTPSRAKAGLQDTSSAWVSVIFVPPQLPLITRVEPGSL